MQNSYLVTIIDAKTGNPDCQVTLPFLPTIGIEIVIEDEIYTVLKVSVDASNIKIAYPEQNKILTSNSTPTQSESEIVIPLVMLCTIDTINNEQSDNPSQSNITQFKK